MGGRRDGVDFAFLNAGVGGTGHDLDGFRRMVGVNVDGVVFGVRRLEQVMSNGGTIVATASLAGLMPMPRGSDLHAHEARSRRLRARDGAAAGRTRHPHQRDLPGVRRHADRHARAARVDRERRHPADASQSRWRRRCSSRRGPTTPGRRGSCSPAGSRCATSSAACRGRDERLPHARRALRRARRTSRSSRATSTRTGCGCTTSTRARAIPCSACTASRRGRTCTGR